MPRGLAPAAPVATVAPPRRMARGTGPAAPSATTAASPSSAPPTRPASIRAPCWPRRGRRTPAAGADAAAPGDDTTRTQAVPEDTQVTAAAPRHDAARRDGKPAPLPRFSTRFAIAR
ncbi:MAG: hypothetical protein H6708_08935 [Kofleriaceae bacterium]|nr:hypothetical protein [Kofleriaceae bacterium]